MQRVTEKRNNQFDESKQKKRKISNNVENGNGNVKREIYNRIIALDPGAKTPIVTCERLREKDIDVDNSDRFSHQMFTKGNVKFDTQEYWCANTKWKYSRRINKIIAKDKRKEVSTRCAESVDEYVEFRMRYFKDKQCTKRGYYRDWNSINI